MKPTIARIVHYTSFGTPGGEHLPEPRAAIITAVHSPEDVALAVLNPTGLFFNIDVPYSETPKAGHWNWPPREGVASGKIASGGIMPCADRGSSDGSISVTLSPDLSGGLDVVAAAAAQMTARSAY